MKVQNIIDQVAQILRRHLSNDVQIFLIGSFAKGSALPTSDIDIGFKSLKSIPPSEMATIRAEIEAIPTLRSIDLIDLTLTDERFKRYALKNAKVL